MMVMMMMMMMLMVVVMMMMMMMINHQSWASQMFRQTPINTVFVIEFWMVWTQKNANEKTLTVILEPTTIITRSFWCSLV